MQIFIYLLVVSSTLADQRIRHHGQPGIRQSNGGELRTLKSSFIAPHRAPHRLSRTISDIPAYAQQPEEYEETQRYSQKQTYQPDRQPSYDLSQFRERPSKRIPVHITVDHPEAKVEEYKARDDYEAYSKEGGEIPGVPGQDYPVFHKAPYTNFDCAKVPVTPGMYADVESGCQAYRVCDDGRHGSKGAEFLCTNGTIFNQAAFTCDWWFNVDCAAAPKYYELNNDPLRNPFYRQDELKRIAASEQKGYRAEAPSHQEASYQQSRERYETAPNSYDSRPRY